MILLDTNVIYYICDLEESPIPKKQLIAKIEEFRKIDDIYISVVSLFEIIARFHRNAGTIRRLITALSCLGIKVLNNQYFKKIAPYQKLLSKIKQKDLDAIWEEVKSNKVEVESRYTTILFIIICSSTIIFECVEDLNNVSDGFLFALLSILKIVRENLLPVFKEVYQDGYKTDDCENIVKKAFYNLLEFFLPSLISLCSEANDLDLTQDGVIQFGENRELYEPEVMKIHAEIKKQITPMFFVRKKATAYAKRKKDKALKKFLSDIDIIINHVLKEETMREYFQSIVNRCLKSGGSFKKNDINDALILSSVGKKDIFITFDHGVIDHMKEYQTARQEYTRSLDQIRQLGINMI